eukprot:3173979-Rhodomonas_salina.2
MSVIVKYRNQNKNRKESSTCWASQPLKIPDTFVLLKHDKATELPSACSHRFSTRDLMATLVLCTSSFSIGAGVVSCAAGPLVPLSSALMPRKLETCLVER